MPAISFRSSPLYRTPSQRLSCHGFVKVASPFRTDQCFEATLMLAPSSSKRGILCASSSHATVVASADAVPEETSNEAATGDLHDVWSTLSRLDRCDTSDMVEVGYIWKHLGIRGEVAIRIRTSLQDMRVGLAGRRYSTFILFQIEA